MILQKHNISLSGKLTWLFVIMAVLLTLLASIFIGYSFKNNFNTHLRPHIDKYLEYLLHDLGNPPDINRAKTIANELSVEIQFYSKDGNWSTNTHKLGLIDLNSIKYHKHLNQGQLDYNIGKYKQYEVVVNVKNDNTVLFILSHPKRYFSVRGIFEFIILISILTLFYFITKKIFSPIHTIKDGIQKIGDGDLAFRLNIQRKDELGDLAANINHMADDIQSMLDAKRQLLLAISHELRSPLTRAKVATAMIDDKHQDSINRDLQEMEYLIEEILEAERLNTKHYKLNKTHFNIIELITELTSLYNNEFIHAPFKETNITIYADQTRIKLLLRNIIDNAIRHTPANSEPVTIRLEHSKQNLSIIVTDHGEGIAEEHLPNILEPFYRADPSRQRKTGGYGLGLYLCKVICKAHKGVLDIKSSLNQGTVVTISLPINDE